MTGVAIRPYREADRSEVAHVWCESALSSWTGELRPNLREELFERLPREVHGGWSVYVATRNDRIVAMLALELPERCLRELFVDPAFQNQGVGKALLAFSKGQMPDGFWLTTSVDNRGARRFYEREGLLHRYDRPHPDHPQAGHATYDWAPYVSRDILMAGFRSRLHSIEADITTLSIDAIVNAANEPLIMGGGVDGAIRRKAGHGMETDLRKIGRCPEGTAVITKAYRLPARWVIHTVAPVFDGGSDRSKELLASCYRSSLALARAHDIASIAFPCIGTGIFGWPADTAASIAFGSAMRHLGVGAKPDNVTFCCFSAEDRSRYRRLIDSLR